MKDKISDELEDDLREEYDLSQLKNPELMGRIGCQ